MKSKRNTYERWHIAGLFVKYAFAAIGADLVLIQKYELLGIVVMGIGAGINEIISHKKLKIAKQYKLDEADYEKN